jgi:hypothetical protein
MAVLGWLEQNVLLCRIIRDHASLPSGMSVLKIAGKVVPMVGSALFLGTIVLPFLEVTYIHGG